VAPSGATTFSASVPETRASLGELAAILRFHIVEIAVLATVVFGWLLTGRYPWAISAVVGVDWLLINLFNRVTDLAEDEANGIRGTALVAAHPRAFELGAWVLLAASFVASHALYPALTPWRLAVQAIGLGYSYRVVWTWRGRRRFKDLYALKNGMSAALFVLTVIAYPVVASGGALAAPRGLWTALALGLFFFLFEQTYEVVYDQRDLEGDRLAGVPTYPVVHGARGAWRIVGGLLAASALPLLAGLATGALGVREGLLLAAPGIQLVACRRFRARPPTGRECVALTRLGSLLLVFYLLGTRAWLALGLPANVFLG
jgi:4-hydroxybenzoate polyprenyltransferase